jgi:hypothetical protein
MMGGVCVCPPLDKLTLCGEFYAIKRHPCRDGMCQEAWATKSGEFQRSVDWPAALYRGDATEFFNGSSPAYTTYLVPSVRTAGPEPFICIKNMLRIRIEYWPSQSWPSIP